jgi:hypothetical protein
VVTVAGVVVVTVEVLGSAVATSVALSRVVVAAGVVVARFLVAMGVALSWVAVTARFVVGPIVSATRIAVALVLVVCPVSAGITSAPGVPGFVVGVGVRARVRVILIVVPIVVAKSSLHGSVELGIGEVASSSLEHVVELVWSVFWVVRSHSKDATGQDLPVLAVETLEELRIAGLVREFSCGTKWVSEF